ncbi:MAG TPA: HD domain-containing phosphohydrolase [Bryobacteraceae bacterium]|nr:HD domain-containing phosphohydrolase [Bryobacteraceae bacterium]
MPNFSIGRRAFLATLSTVCLAISVSFVAINVAIRRTIKNGIKESLGHQSFDRARTGRHLRAALLAGLVETDPSLAASVLQAEVARGDSRLRAARALESRLRALREKLDCDLVAALDADGSLVAAVAQNPRDADGAALSGISASGLAAVHGVLYEITAAPFSPGARGIGTLAVGKRLDLASLPQAGRVALLRNGRIVQSTFPPSESAAVERQLRAACLQAGCEMRLGAGDYLVMPVGGTAAVHDGSQLLTFQSIDRAMEKLTGGFKILFPIIGACGVLLAMSISLLASRAVAKPLDELIARLKTSEASGRLRPDFPENSPTREVNQLAASFNRAARAVEHSSQKLENAYLEFVETMAQALDARDPYTAGHSDRVSDYSVAIAAALALPPEEIETIRIGARLHDIGKIGIPDAVLQKSGYLTPEEYALVKLHPQIGKRILERVGRFDKYLPIVELHHEDHDGRGYPYGLKGHEVPLAVRIVHVADVYDALTTDRAYRAAMSPARAVEILSQCSGSSFEPEVVRAFLAILAAQPAPEPLAQDLALLGRLG